jgi:hypothetical protein
MDLITVLALVAFGVATVLAVIEKGWVLALIAVGLFLVTLEASGAIKS